jgi:hypothetical protein
MPLNGRFQLWRMRTPDPQRKLRQVMAAINLASDSGHFFCDYFFERACNSDGICPVAYRQ